MRPVKKLAVTSTVAILSLGLTACGSNSTTDNSSAPAGSSGSSSGGDAAQLKVGLAYDVGGRGDHSFNDSAAKGLDEAEKQFGIKPTEVAATNGENDAARVSRLQQLAQSGNQAIIAVGFTYAAAVGKVAKQFPNVKFAIVDDASADSKGDNVDQITFTEEQGSYLAGAAAALKSKSGRIGFVGGVEVPLIKKFAAGYTAGAKKINPNIKVDTAYLTQPPDFSGFGDPAKGRTAAEGMYDNGADVVYHAAGGSGGGVFEAAQAAGAKAIGVDSDQALTADESVRDVILTSMLKNIDVAVFAYLQGVADGETPTGPTVYDLAVDGVGYSTTGGQVDDIADQLDEYKQQIIDGDITVPTTP